MLNLEKQKTKTLAREMAQVVKYLPCKHEHPSFVPTIHV